MTTVSSPEEQVKVESDEIENIGLALSADEESSSSPFRSSGTSSTKSKDSAETTALNLFNEMSFLNGPQHGNVPTAKNNDTSIDISKSHSAANGDRDQFSSSEPIRAIEESSMPVSFQQQNLEDRVQDLEAKLATLSLILQQQQPRFVPRSASPRITPATSDDEDDHLRNTPLLDSPAPPTRKRSQRRNLSFRVLYQDDGKTHRIDDSQPEDLDPTLLFLPNDLPTDLVREVSPTISEEEKAPLKSSSPPPPTVPSDEQNLEDPTTTADAKASNPKVQESLSRKKWLDFLNSFQDSSYDADKQMEEFVKVPSAVESLLSFGFWICVDSFLYVLTVLPIRFTWSCLILVRSAFYRTVLRTTVPEGPFRFHRRHSYQIIQVGIIYIVYSYVLLPVSLGKMYHWIRGQAMLKLYVLIAMVEVFDRLMCSLGQDCLDSLYWNTTRRPRSSRLIVSVVVVLVYAMLHTFLLFIHVATLNVAMNSADQALLSLLIGGNFAEIKSTVFKKYNKPNLFKITASDICERFKLALFLGLVLILNLSQGMNEKMLMSYFQMCGIVWCAEWLSDWIKHAFITKFNYIPSTIYPEYALLLAGDVTGIGHEGVNLDHSHAVVKRIGLAQIPLVCVMFRYLREAAKYVSYWESAPSNWVIGVGVVVTWSILLVMKLSLGRFLLKISHNKLQAAPEFSGSSSGKKNK